MMGDEISPGIIALTTKALFDLIEEVHGREYSFRVTYLELYKIIIHDFLSEERANLAIRENDSFPARFKAFHVVHESAFVDVLFAVIHPFLNPKIRNRIHFHGDSLASLHSYIPADILPLELGGKTGPFNNADWYEKLLSKEELFIDRSKYGFNINHLDSYPSIFGTYKRVCID